MLMNYHVLVKLISNSFHVSSCNVDFLKLLKFYFLYSQVGINPVHILPGVGKNLRNHVTFYLKYELKNVRDTTDLDWATALDYLLNKRGPMSSSGKIYSFYLFVYMKYEF